MFCPLKGEVVYIGSTKNFYKRFSQHISSIPSAKTDLYKYFNEVGKMPVFEILEVVDAGSGVSLNQRESYYINDAKRRGIKLFNDHYYKSLKASINVCWDLEKELYALADYHGVCDFVSEAVEKCLFELDSISWDSFCEKHPKVKQSNGLGRVRLDADVMLKAREYIESNRVISHGFYTRCIRRHLPEFIEKVTKKEEYVN